MPPPITEATLALARENDRLRGNVQANVASILALRKFVLQLVDDVRSVVEDLRRENDALRAEVARLRAGGAR